MLKYNIKYYMYSEFLIPPHIILDWNWHGKHHEKQRSKQKKLSIRIKNNLEGTSCLSSKELLYLEDQIKQREN
jgi:hypothetical protein